MAEIQQPSLHPVVEAEETVYVPAPANNGAGPLWCYGSTCLVRSGRDVFMSGLETLADQKPLNNTRWLLFQRTGAGWKQVQADSVDRTREGCPLGVFADGRLFLSANPTLAEPGAYGGPARPEVLAFDAAQPARSPQRLAPAWEGAPAFTEHSYRGFAADGPGRELLLLNILGHEAQCWSFYDRTGAWSRCGRLVFPMGVKYETPEPVRLCYPAVALKNRAAHVLAISDIVEPVKAWREYKLKLNEGRPWDYDFRRLYYTFTPDIAAEPFAPWREIATLEKTAGYIVNLDLWLDGQGRAHLLWREQTVWDARVRDKFFPGLPIRHGLHYAVMESGEVIRRSVLVEGGEGASGEIPQWARLHATPEGRLFMFYHVTGTDAAGRAVSENRLLEIGPDGRPGPPVPVPLTKPFARYFVTASERGGSPPSPILDVMGVTDGDPAIRYARINLLDIKGGLAP
jgi:hypothetical protein